MDLNGGQITDNLNISGHSILTPSDQKPIEYVVVLDHVEGDKYINPKAQARSLLIS